MGTSTGAGCGTHSLRFFFSHCRPCLIRAIAKDGKCKEGFMVDELGSDNSLEYAPAATSEEAELPGIQRRKIRNICKLLSALQTRAHVRYGQTSLTVASRKARSSGV